MDCESLSIETLRCCLSKYTQKHFIKQAKTLPCNHYACNQCLNELMAVQKEIECLFPKCKKKYPIENLFELPQNEYIDEVISKNSANLFNLLKKDFKTIYDNFNDVDFEQTIEKQSEFIEYEIDLRIESLKLQLDKLSQQYHERLKFYKRIAIESIPTNEINGKKQECMELLHQEPGNSVESLMEYDKALQKNISEIEDFINSAPKLLFEPTNTTIDDSMVAKFPCPLQCAYEEIVSSKALKVPHKFLNRIAYLESKKQFLITDREDKSVKLIDYNGNFIGDYNPNSIFQYPFAIFVNNKTNEIFVGDYKKQSIFVFNESFEFKYQFGDGDLHNPNTIEIDYETNLLYCTDFWHDKVTVWGLSDTGSSLDIFESENSTDGNTSINEDDNTKSAKNARYTYLRMFNCDAPAYIKVRGENIYIVSALDLELDDTNKKLKCIKKGSNCVFVIDKFTYKILNKIQLNDWIEPYGLYIDKKLNIYAAAALIDADKNLSDASYFFKIDKNGNLVKRISFENYIPIDIFIVDNKMIAISYDQYPVKYYEFKE